MTTAPLHEAAPFSFGPTENFVVTNSLASNNHVAVHSAYSGYRKSLLEASVELYEIRANAGHEAAGDAAPETLTLHTKLILVDQQHVIVGSLNLDPRSLRINAEMALVIDSPELVSRITAGIGPRLSTTEYRLELDADGRLEWHGNVNGEPVLANSEPLASRWRRIMAFFLKVAPESQL